ncbi:histone-lysine N-methyltransferase SMYD3 [Aethina tumida]|uniref:histone-lysine N-methyltransferase SMYD3 n=1 Tax=Aethina tumida TaxID=116153 RepID=UPI002147CA40|nr:histone-lysine N-methyltransferase SMYD3 [Aethina tumida]
MSHESDMRIKKREVKAGTIIHQEKPFVYVLSSKYRTDYCDYCFKKSQLSKCSGCKYVFYCGKGCQKLGWDIHKHECRNLGKVAPRIVPDGARLLSRLIKKIQKGGDQVREYYSETGYRMFKDLMSHYPNVKNDQRRMEHISALYGVLYEFLGNDRIPNSAELMGLYGRMCVNSFNICNQELQSLGTGIYLAASILDHSCEPNALAVFDGTTIQIRALKDLPCVDWSQIFISYIDVLNTTKDRQEELQKTYYFLCECPRCLEPEPMAEMTGAACPDPKCDFYIDVNMVLPGDKCKKCGEVVTEEFLERYKEVMEFTTAQIESMKQFTYLDTCKLCLDKHKGVLYRHNLKHVKILDLAFESSIDFQLFNNAKEYGLELIDSFYKYYGQIHPLTGLLHLKLGKILLYHNDITNAKKHLNEASHILKITHGITSSIYKEEVMPLLFQVHLE